MGSTPTFGQRSSSGGGGGPFQPLDADLTAIAALTGTGYAHRIGVDTWALDAIPLDQYLLLAGRTGATNDPLISLDQLGRITGSADGMGGLGLKASPRTIANTTDTIAFEP